MVTYKSFKEGKRCHICRKHSLSFIENYLNQFDYTLISKEYINANTPIKIMCPQGHIYDVKFAEFKNHNRRCPICNSSKGEERIRLFLKKNNIKFNKEYKFKDCKFKTYLPFDFYLPNYNCCVEFDGRHHFDIIKNRGGIDRLIETKIRDTVKNVYCKNNNIKLIRIPYWEIENIENILSKELINKQ